MTSVLRLVAKKASALKRLAARWWTLLGAVGTKHTAIPRLGPQQGVAVDTFMEKSTSIERHLFKRTMAAMGALYHRLETS